MKFLTTIGLLILTSVFAQAQFLVPVFEKPVRINPLSDNTEESSPFIFNQGTEIVYHRLYLSQGDGDVEVRGKDIWYSDLDQKATDKVDDTATLKKVWRRPYRLFRDDEVEGLNQVFGMSQDGQRIYLINTTFTKDTFEMRLVYLDRKGKNGWADEYVEFEVPGLIFDGRLLELTMNKQEDVILLSMAPKPLSQNEDLFVSLKQPDGSWSELIDLGPNINTNRFEITPFLSENKKRLYFSSNGHPGFGDADIFMSSRLDDSWQKWSRPLNMGKSINSAAFDAYFTPAQDGEIYFISDRDAELNDLYYTIPTGELTAPNTDSISGQFFYKSLAVEETELEVLDADGNLITIITTDEKGRFNFLKLSADEDYVLRLSAEDNTELVGGSLYFLDDDGNKTRRYTLDNDGVFKSADEITDKETIQGVFNYNNLPVSEAYLIIQDANQFNIDTVLTDSSGKFQYQKLVYDTVFNVFPQDLASDNIALYDLYLTDSEGERSRTMDVTLGSEATGKGRFTYQSLPIANTVIKVFDANGELIETIYTAADGSFTYRKLNFDEEGVKTFSLSDGTMLEGGIVYITPENESTQRLFITSDNKLIAEDAMGKEIIQGKYEYKKLGMDGAGIVLLDANGFPLDTLYTNEDGSFSYEKMKLDENYTLMPLNLTEDQLADLDIYLTDQSGNVSQKVQINKDGGFAFGSAQELAEKPKEIKPVVKTESKPKQKPVATPAPKADARVIYFDFGSEYVKPSEMQKLRSLVSAMKNSNTKISLVGHTDSVDTDEKNQIEGMKRAESVKQKLVSLGIADSRIETASKGESEPAESNETAAGRKKNRRVVISF